MDCPFFDLDICRFDDNGHDLIVLDQTLLPQKEQMATLSTAADVADAIRRLVVRGAPAIGVAAAMGLVASLYQEPHAASHQEFIQSLKRNKAIIQQARPTAVNLEWALNRMEQYAVSSSEQDPQVLLELLREEALLIKQENAQICRKIGEYGKELIHPHSGVLTHCNAGHLATGYYGTALAPIYSAFADGVDFKVYCDETRPLLQGARLTAYELSRSGVDTTLICDNMAATLMSQHRIQLVLVGCDRVAANGDTANKIGTLGVAIMAHHYGIPFYVCGPLSSFDAHCPSGHQIPIEQREGQEITTLWYHDSMAPKEIQTFNPAFDITPIELIAGFVTEIGIINPRTLHEVLSNQ